jgi:hypothetical protein
VDLGSNLFRNGNGWGDSIVGVDKCIYWPPLCANRVLKCDPETQRLPSLVGGVLGEEEGEWKWNGGALATDGVIYCIPYCSTQVLAIDPFKEISMTLQNNFRQHPQELGRLFVKGEGDETFYDSAVRKFGMILRKFLNLLKNVPPWTKNGLILLMATPFHSLWLQLYVRIVQRL